MTGFREVSDASDVMMLWAPAQNDKREEHNNTTHHPPSGSIGKVFPKAKKVEVGHYIQHNISTFNWFQSLFFIF